ncbi:MAG: hypothetical protein ACREBG_27300, partial [Pyrinomonadaceae bacterium]
MIQFSSLRHLSFQPRWFRVIFVFVVLLGTYDIARPDSSAAKQPKFMIIGYVFGPTNIYDISAEKLTHINYAFALVSKDGEIVLNNTEAPARLS